MQSKQVRSRPLVAKLTAVVSAATAVLPLTFTRAVAKAVGFMAACLPLNPTKVSSFNLQLCYPELPPAERAAWVRRSLQHTAMGLIELGPLWRRPIERLAALEESVEGEELLHAAMAAGRGTLLLLPHLGNWEFLNHFLLERYVFHYLYRPPRVAEFDALISAARERTGAIAVPTTRCGVRRLLTTLRDGGLVLILPDQEPLKSHGVSAPFFGVPALTMTLVGGLLRRTGATALFAYAERRPCGRFRVCFQTPPEEIGVEDPVDAATALNRGVEHCVRACPEQYLWSYKRFKTAPPGELTPYCALWSRRKRRREGLRP